MEPKFIVFALALLVAVPAAIAACRMMPGLLRVVVIALIWSSCEPDALGINFASRELYRAATRGFEVSLADLCALVLLFSLPRESTAPRRRLPLLIPLAIYWLTGLLSWVAAGPPLATPDDPAVPFPHFEVGLYPLFELTKIARGALLYIALARYMRDDRAIRDVFVGLLVATLHLAFDALTDRYLFGVNRVRASLGHPNTLATYMAMMGSLLFAWLLQSRKPLESAAFALGTGLAAITVLMTISRGGLVALALGFATVTALLLSRNLTARNVAILAIGALAAVGAVVKASDTLLQRFVGEQDAAADAEYRGYYNDQARLMADERPFGVGLGNFSAWSWERYAAEVNPDNPPGTPAHNVWYLTLGEAGWAGLAAFALFWLRAAQVILAGLLGLPRGPAHAACAAAAGALAACHLQSMLQLGYRQTPLFLLIHVCLALAAAAWRARPPAGVSA